VQLGERGQGGKFLRRCVPPAIVCSGAAVPRYRLREWPRRISLHLQGAIVLFRRVGDYAAAMAKRVMSRNPTADEVFPQIKTIPVDLPLVGTRALLRRHYGRIS
jgi:hypothetical protein